MGVNFADFILYQGNCLDVLKQIPNESVQCFITSPPYYGLRDYGTAKQIGLEETPDEYIENLVAVFREIKRILKNDGTLWVNVGDSYSGSGRGRDSDGNVHFSALSAMQGTNVGSTQGQLNKRIIKCCKPKDLIGIPWTLAFALRSDGWYLRQDIIWHKPAPMPESVKDRCTRSHEYIFLLSKKPNYYYDYKAIQEDCVGENNKNILNDLENKYGYSKYLDSKQESSVRQGMNRERGNKIIEVRKKLPSQLEFVEFMRSKTNVNILAENTQVKRSTIEHWFRKDEIGFSFPSVNDWNSVKRLIDDCSQEFKEMDAMITNVVYETDAIDKNYNGKRNKRDVWTVGVAHNKYTHFATFPEKLIEPCVLAGTRKGDTVIDCFSGSGTTGVVAVKNQRNYIGIDLNADYNKIAEQRIKNEAQNGFLF